MNAFNTANSPYPIKRKILPEARKVVGLAFDELEKQEKAFQDAQLTKLIELWAKASPERKQAIMRKLRHFVKLGRRERRKHLLEYRSRNIKKLAIRRKLIKVFSKLPESDQIELLSAALELAEKHKTEWGE